jgi:mRNA interferase MazF
MHNHYKRGSVYLVQEGQIEGGEIKKTRPWVLVGTNAINNARSTIVAIPLSTQVKAIPNLSIKVIFNGMNICAIIDQIRALDKKRFIRYEGELAEYEMDLIDDGLRKVLSL